MRKDNGSLFHRLIAAAVSAVLMANLTACTKAPAQPTHPPHLIITEPEATNPQSPTETASIQPVATTIPKANIDYRNLVTDAYTDALINKYGSQCCYHIPQFNLPFNSAEQLNGKIYKQCFDILQKDVYNYIMDDEWYPFIGEMVYIWNYKDDLASVVIQIDAIDVAYWEYYVYTISTATGQEISMDELLTQFGMDRKAYYDLVYKRLTQYWDEWLADAESNGNFLANDTFFKECVARTLSDENICKTTPYINSNGGLSFVAEIYSMAGADSYLHLINAEGELEADYLECTQSHTYCSSVSADDPLQYFIENCDRRYFSAAEISGLDAEELVYARNAIYAKSGRIFNMEKLASYFTKYSWYAPSIPAEEFTEDMLNQYQTANRDLIVARESELDGITAEEAYAIACEYWDYQEGEIDEETGFELYMIDDGMLEHDGTAYYSFRLRWQVTSENGESWLSTVDQVYINARTGECSYTIYS